MCDLEAFRAHLASFRTGRNGKYSGEKESGHRDQKRVLLKCVGRGKAADTDPEDARADGCAGRKHLG